MLSTKGQLFLFFFCYIQCYFQHYYTLKLWAPVLVSCTNQGLHCGVESGHRCLRDFGQQNLTVPVWTIMVLKQLSKLYCWFKLYISECILIIYSPILSFQAVFHVPIVTFSYKEKAEAQRCEVNCTQLHKTCLCPTCKYYFATTAIKTKLSVGFSIGCNKCSVKYQKNACTR